MVWWCQPERAHGVKCTALTDIEVSLCPWAMASTYTSPVNQSSGPLAVGGRAWRLVTGSLPSIVVGSEGEQGLDGSSLVHGGITLGGLVEGEGEVEHAAGVDRAGGDAVEVLGQE